MTTLTKIFIVFHVVLSLLLAAGLIVFVNRTENFRTTSATLTSNLNSARAEALAAKAETTRQQTIADALRVARDTAAAESQSKVAQIQLEIGRQQAQLAEASANAKIIQVALDNATAALNASEAARKAQSDIVDSTRTDNNTLATKNSQLNLAVADLTNRLEVAQRQVTNLNETVAEKEMQKERAEKTLADNHIQLSNNPGVSGGAPPIDGVVRHTNMIAGILYATISVGSQDQVKAGMKFSLVDREHGTFLGELTVDQVDEKEATGKLEGPHISDVHVNTEVKTQL